MAKQPDHPSQPTPFRTTIGGQALIEGILMRGPEKQAIVVRKPDGDLVTKVEELHLIKERHPILGVPLIRGTVNFLDSMVKGVQALMFSAEFYPEDEEEAAAEPSKFEVWLEKKLGSEQFMKVLIALAVVLGIGFSVCLFILLPAFLGGLLQKVISSYLVCNLLEGVLRIVIFLLYLILCSKQKDMKRVFAYHGAEHKTIFCYERGLELTVDHVRDMPRHHPRCGTSFLFVVLVLSILLFSVVQVESVLLQMLLKLLLLPVLVSITYEINRFVGRHDTALTRIITAPGLWLQNFTTNEPDDSMIEVGIAALQAVLPDLKGQDAW
ncbi:MAG: DUF1385 domain-containing protein [Clostridiales bacterium]|jgi:uncharacterized protein YqhQ|nr:MAG: DUF1385 domain-containing protein [Clostridiales bacterium]